MNTFNRDIIKNPGIFKENVLDAHADFIAYSSEEELRTKEISSRDRIIYDSSLRMSLNGVWKFYYSNNINSAPEGFEKTDYNDNGWDEIRVPSNIQFRNIL